MKRHLRWKLLDNFRRKLFLKFELRRLILCFISKNTASPQCVRYLSLFYKSKILRLSSKVQHKNRCVKTGRIWAVNKPTQLSRFTFQREAYSGNLPGFRRASW